MLVTESQIIAVLIGGGSIIGVLAKMIHLNLSIKIAELGKLNERLLARVESLEHRNAELLVHEEKITVCPVQACPWKKSHLN